MDHTQTPWIVKHGDGKATITSDDGHGPFALVWMRPSMTNNLTELKANARLIAAAPELLEACRMAQRWFDDMGPVLGESDSAHAERMLRMALQDAIAKARADA